MTRREDVIRIFAEIRDADDAQRVCRKIMSLLESRHDEIAIWGFPADQERLGGAFHALEIGAVIPTASGFTAIYSCWPEDADWACNFTKAEKQYILDRICTIAGAEAQLLNGFKVYPGFTDYHDGEDEA